MKIVIDMDDSEYQEIVKDRHINHLRIIKAIKNGISLPKGHGRLIDVNDLLDDIGLEDCGYNRDVNMGEIITLENIDRIPTIIEADGGGE